MHSEDLEAEVDTSALPTDPVTLQLLVSDLNRRLINAKHMVNAARAAQKRAEAGAEAHRARIAEVCRLLRLEVQKNDMLQRKKAADDESAVYERYKVLYSRTCLHAHFFIAVSAFRQETTEKLHEELRVAMVDFAISGAPREPLKVTRIKKKLEEMESRQDSQKKLVCRKLFVFINYCQSLMLFFLYALVTMQLMHYGQIANASEELCSAAQHGEASLCTTLLLRGADVNEMDAAGYLPLHYACSNGFADVAQLLLEFGADATSYLTGHSAVEICARKGHKEVIPFLCIR